MSLNLFIVIFIFAAIVFYVYRPKPGRYVKCIAIEDALTDAFLLFLPYSTIEGTKMFMGFYHKQMYEKAYNYIIAMSKNHSVPEFTPEMQSELLGTLLSYGEPL
jgi:hypothetical protein